MTARIQKMTPESCPNNVPKEVLIERVPGDPGNTKTPRKDAPPYLPLWDLFRKPWGSKFDYSYTFSLAKTPAASSPQDLKKHISVNGS